MLKGNSYEEIYKNFKWNIPERANIAWYACDRHAVANPDSPALVYQGLDDAVSTFSFGQLKDASSRLGNVLKGLGMNRGDRLGIVLSQRPETGITHLACFKTGIISLPLFVQFGPDGLRHRLADSGARIAVTDLENLDKVEQVARELPDLEYILVIDGGGGDGMVRDYWQLIENASSDLTILDTAAFDPAVIVYTSGTTGPPKGAVHSHAMTLAHEGAISFTHDFFPQKNDRFWTPADWAWGGGLFDCLLPAWLAGVPVVAHRFRKFDPEAAFRLINRHNIRNAFMPPTALKMMRQIPNPTGNLKPGMRSIASGGEALGEEILAWGEKTFGFTINEFWGQTEANLLTGNCATIMEVKRGSVGLPVPGHDVAVLDDEGRELPDGEVGVLAARRPDPIFFLEYWKNPEGTKKKFIGNWLLTGDMGHRDEDGYYWFQGRDDDIISSGAYRIGPTEIEETIMKHADVSMVAVIGKPDDIRGTIVKAFVVPREGSGRGDALKESIQELVRSNLAAYEYPREIEFVNDLPMTTSGKILRRELRDLEKQRKEENAGEGET